MKNLFLVFIALLSFNFSSVSEAQTLKGKLNIQRQANKQVDLYRTEGKYKYKIDSTKVLADGSFSFGYKTHPKGYYKIALGNENNIVDVILNPTESVVSLAFAQVRLEKGLTVLQSNENKAYWEFKKKDSSIQKKIKALKQQRGQFRSQGNDAKVNEMTNEVNKLEKELFSFVQIVINKYPSSYFSEAKVASLANNPTNKAKYFDDLDFTNENFIRSDVFATRFQDYIIKHSGHTEVGYYNAVDDIMKKAKQNEKVFEFALYNLLDGFYGSGLEDVATYIMEEYFYGEACGDIEINDLLRQKADLIKNLQKVSGFLGQSDAPTPISDSEIQRILGQVSESAINQKSGISFEIGEKVKVCDGPFASFSGLIEEIDEEKSRLKVSVSIFGRPTPVDLEFNQVEKN